jgi:hypothetical protein
VRGVEDNIERALAALAGHDRLLALHYLSRAINELAKSVGAKEKGDPKAAQVPCVSGFS